MTIPRRKWPKEKTAKVSRTRKGREKIQKHRALSHFAKPVKRPNSKNWMHSNLCEEEQIPCQKHLHAKTNNNNAEPEIKPIKTNHKQLQNKANLPTRLVTVGDQDHYPLAKSNEQLYIATLNTRTLRTPESLVELELALKDIKWDILGICEMRRAHETIEERSGYILFSKGEEGGQRGVGFLIKTYLRKHVKDLIGVSDRIAILNISIPSYKKNWSIIQVYAPTEKADRLELQDFYDKLTEALTTCSNNYIILMGDLNAQVGEKQSADEQIIGNFGYGKRSTNGQKLVDFLHEHNLYVLNSLYKKNKNKKMDLEIS